MLNDWFYTILCYILSTHLIVFLLFLNGHEPLDVQWKTSAKGINATFNVACVKSYMDVLGTSFSDVIRIEKAILYKHLK